MLYKIIFFLLLSGIVPLHLSPLQAQSQQTEAVTYEEIYDNPESINKLFIGFQPIVGELWATNPNVGFGFDASYYLDNVAHFRVNIRKAYADRFDFARYGALSNSDMENNPEVFNHYEFGGTYHIKDFTGESETKMVLKKSSYAGSNWAARVPLQIVVPSRLRKIYGARAGGVFFDSSVDLNRILERQGLTFDDIRSTEGDPLETSYTNNQGLEKEVKAFSNLQVFGFYLGGSMSWIRNVAVEIDNHQPGVDDQILTAYFDILLMPWVNLENLFYQGQEFLIDPIETTPIGFRLGLDGKFNRTLSWGYGGEFGYKPGLKKGGFSALLKISIPVFSTNLDNQVEAFGK